VTWGEGPLDVWNPLLALFLIGLLVMDLLAGVWSWRARAQETAEEIAALRSGDLDAARRAVVHGTMSLLMAIAGLVVVVIHDREETRLVGALAIVFFGAGALVLRLDAFRAYRRHGGRGKA
jgi:hypothetical protein